MLQKGFSLVELLVVIAIIAIISSIAYPSYKAYTCDTYKAQNIIDLKVCAMCMERHYSEGFTYVAAVIDGSDKTICSDQSPTEGQKKFDITLVEAKQNLYTLRATPVAGHTCGIAMELTQAGVLTTLLPSTTP